MVVANSNRADIERRRSRVKKTTVKSAIQKFIPADSECGMKMRSYLSMAFTKIQSPE